MARSGLKTAFDEWWAELTPDERRHLARRYLLVYAALGGAYGLMSTKRFETAFETWASRKTPDEREAIAQVFDRLGWLVLATGFAYALVATAVNRLNRATHRVLDSTQAVYRSTEAVGYSTDAVRDEVMRLAAETSRAQRLAVKVGV